MEVDVYEQIIELPFVASTTGDTTRNTRSSARASQRLRETTRGQLGVPDFGTVSFGRRGRVRIEPAVLVPFVRVARTTPDSADSFQQDLRKYGVLESAVGRSAYEAAGTLVAYLKTNVRSGGVVKPLARRVNNLLAQMAFENTEVRRFAEEQSDFWRRFSRAEGKFSRLPGRLVRIEGDEALLSVWNEKRAREELRAVDASLLSDIGVNGEGDPLILYEVQYAPGVQVSTVVPAVMTTPTEEQLEDDERELRQYETPLPDMEALEGARLAVDELQVEPAAEGADATTDDHSAQSADA